MAVYKCFDCDQFIDGDWDNCTEIEDNELICTDCAEKREDELKVGICTKCKKNKELHSKWLCGWVCLKCAHKLEYKYRGVA